MLNSHQMLNYSDILRQNVVCHVTGKQLKMLSHETVHRNRIKLVATKKGVRQSEMFNYFVYSRLGNNKDCEQADPSYCTVILLLFLLRSSIKL